MQCMCIFHSYLQFKKSRSEHYSLCHPEAGNGIVKLIKSWSSAISAVLMASFWSPQRFFSYLNSELIFRPELEHIRSGLSHENVFLNLWNMTEWTPWRRSSGWRAASHPIVILMNGRRKVTWASQFICVGSCLWVFAQALPGPRVPFFSSSLPTWKQKISMAHLLCEALSVCLLA